MVRLSFAPLLHEAQGLDGSYRTVGIKSHAQLCVPSRRCHYLGRKIVMLNRLDLVYYHIYKAITARVFALASFSHNKIANFSSNTLAFLWYALEISVETLARRQITGQLR
jgi:hypothetical protein